MTFYVKIFSTAINAIKIVVGGLVSFFKGVWTKIKAPFENAVAFYSGLFTNAVTAIKTAFSTVGAFFSGIWSNITGTFSNVVSWFSDKFGSAWQAIKDKFSGWADFWGGLWNKIKDKFTGMGTKLSDAISGAIKGAMNKVISKIESIINKAIKFINSAIRLANKLPGVDVNTLSTISLPRLAKGGVLAKGQLGLLEGSGAEAVVPLEKNTQWISKVAESFREEFASLARQNRADNVTQALAYDEAVDAFKEALSEMQIVLDDETAGKFVERTVTSYIYA